MDRTILNILFSWKGSLTSREFRAGLSILFLSLSAFIALYVVLLLFTIIAGYIGSEYLMRFHHLRDILYLFIPALVPLSFILSYSSFVVTMKRMRSFTSNTFVAVLAGIVGFVFFASFYALQKIAMYALDTNQSSYAVDRLGSLMSVLSVIMLGLMLVGLVVFIVLSIAWKEEVREPQAGFNATKYALCLGNLMAVSLGIVALLTLTSIVFGEIFLLYVAYNPWVLYLAVGIPHLFLFILFTIYAVYRLKDAGKSYWWAVGFIGGFVAITALTICGFKWYWGLTILSFAYQLCLNVYIAGIYALFLLPTKAIEQNVGEIDR